MRKMLVLMALLFLAGYARADQYGHSDQHYGGGSFGAGYEEGYEHGRADGHARAGFEFRHDDEYQRGDCEFRVGYVEGYADGFFNKPPITHGGGYDDDDHGYPGPGGGSGGGGGVVVFTERDFRGSAQSFSPGQYPYLSGRLNDSIESIRVEGPFRVILFDRSDFQGQRTVVERTSYDLGYFRNRAASMIIEPIGYR
jgi:hypothetical protein